MPIVEFLCGCKTGNIETRENLLTMDSVAIDDAGMLICAIHGLRRKGWRSVPASSTRPGVKHGNYLSGTPAEIEGRMLFGDDWLIDRPLSINFTTVDRRDNRDPEEIYYKSRHGKNVGELILDESAKMNGKVKPDDGLDLLKRNRL